MCFFGGSIWGVNVGDSMKTKGADISPQKYEHIKNSERGFDQGRMALLNLSRMDALRLAGSGWTLDLPVSQSRRRFARA